MLSVSPNIISLATDQLCITYCGLLFLADGFSLLYDKQTNKTPEEARSPPLYYLSAGSTGILLFPRLLYKDIIRIDVTLSDDKFEDYLSVFVNHDR